MLVSPSLFSSILSYSILLIFYFKKFARWLAPIAPILFELKSKIYKFEFKSKSKLFAPIDVILLFDRWIDFIFGNNLTPSLNICMYLSPI